ncbi:MAG: aminomethyl-transferring glycine dehydrogenase subunit GcvPA [Magnetococcales bacterium]|nr:aminomethyl-transferring glycine dehydrogenase subunit GcvPA [Magnetococcales bacterium]
MPFIPHTPDDIQVMLATIGVDSVERLFEEIDPELRCQPLNLPEPLEEWQVTRLMRQRAARDRSDLCLIGAGSYAHHIPAVVWQMASRGEFYTAYTPYQAEASQGTLQILYEFQTMMASLTGLEAANASMYDGASALAEAILMAIRLQGSGKKRRILIPATLNRRFLSTVQALVRDLDIELVTLPFNTATGITDPQSVESHKDDGYCALVIPQPNFFGGLEECDTLTDIAHQHGALVIGVVNPVALGLLTPPGAWGAKGADIACGEGQPLGAPPSSGGPGFGFMCCRTAHVRQLPGRIVGSTVDHHGQRGFVLTLQAREQHIRRSRATSNICSNQGLMTIAAAIHLSLLGPNGLKRIALACHDNATQLLAMLLAIPGVSRVFSQPFFHEVAVRLPTDVTKVLEKLQQRGIAGGYPLARDYPGMDNTLLICTTETLSPEDRERFVATLREVMA